MIFRYLFMLIVKWTRVICTQEFKQYYGEYWKSYWQEAMERTRCWREDNMRKKKAIEGHEYIPFTNVPALLTSRFISVHGLHVSAGQLHRVNLKLVARWCESIRGTDVQMGDALTLALVHHSQDLQERDSHDWKNIISAIDLSMRTLSGILLMVLCVPWPGDKINSRDQSLSNLFSLIWN